MKPLSKVGIGVAGLYLMVALAAWVLPWIAKPGESLAGIFVVPLAVPWSLLLGWIMDTTGVDSMVFKAVFLLVGISINAAILYFLTAKLFPARRG